MLLLIWAVSVDGNNQDAVFIALLGATMADIRDNSSTKSGNRREQIQCACYRFGSLRSSLVVLTTKYSSGPNDAKIAVRMKYGSIDLILLPLLLLSRYIHTQAIAQNI